MDEEIVSRLKIIEDSLSKLKKIAEKSRNEYLRDPYIQAAAERFLHKAIEATIDLEKIDLISFAGSSGIFKMSWGTHISYIRDVLVFLKNNEIEFHKLMEIDYMSSKKLPEDVRNRLIFILGGSER